MGSYDRRERALAALNGQRLVSVMDTANPLSTVTAYSLPLISSEPNNNQAQVEGHLAAFAMINGRAFSGTNGSKLVNTSGQILKDIQVSFRTSSGRVSRWRVGRMADGEGRYCPQSIEGTLETASYRGADDPLNRLVTVGYSRHGRATSLSINGKPVMGPGLTNSPELPAPSLDL